ncbi:Scr1 family TA system antitoxin-like transcriptional regulator [Streptomyces cyaneofuscatus]|uniref:Scr1 family TA system antitoxin-like transcriptional regulator n=1 Tax=Streptomyces cyaneofuscatus TaxID=66883 RepID=UPI00365F3DAB
MSPDPIPINRLARRIAGPGATKTAAMIMLGLTIIDLRDAVGITQKDLAKGILVSNSTISRLEKAEAPPEPRTVEAVIEYLQLAEPQRDELRMLLSRALEPEWFQRQYSDVTPKYLRRLLGLEAMAIYLTTYDVRLVAGLLQTPEYSSCVIRTGLHISEWGSPEIAMRLALRRERQERVFGQAEPPRCVFLMDESVLYRRVGPDDVMREQMQHMLQIARFDPFVTIRFVLLDRMIAGNEASMAGGMAHLQFGHGGLPDLVYVEGYGKADYHPAPETSPEERLKPWPTKENDFERHLQLLLRISGEACASPAASVRMLEEAVARFS